MDESEIRERDETAVRDTQMVIIPVPCPPCSMLSEAVPFGGVVDQEMLGMKQYQDLLRHPQISTSLQK
jgi:hypothetical protein